MAKILVIAEQNKGNVSQSTYSTLNAALQISQDIDVLLASDFDVVAPLLAKCDGVKTVLVCKHERFAHPLAEDLAQIIVQIAKDYTHLFVGASTFGKNMMPRVAAMLDVGQISDLNAIINENTFIRPIYAGNAFEKVRSNDKIIVATIRPTAFDPVKTGNTSAKIMSLKTPFTPFEKVQFKQEKSPQLERPELTSAKIVVSGGRGFKNAENFKMLALLADKLNAAIGATRAAVDAGFVANELQVGQTGKVVAPQLYIAIGISGAIQHLAGMKDSKIIVAINQDSDAPIFQVADYGLVGDLFTIVPQLIAAL